MAKRKTIKKKRLTKKSKCDFLCGRWATMRILGWEICDECASATNEAPLSKVSVDDGISVDGSHKTASGSGKENEMNSPRKTLPQTDIEAQKRREAREKKPTRDWTAAERREAFLEAREAERKGAGAGVVDECELCDECHEYKRERGSSFCRHCIERGRQYAD
jgi:hypothetical protein